MAIARIDNIPTKSDKDRDLAIESLRRKTQELVDEVNRLTKAVDALQVSGTQGTVSP